MKFSLIPIQIIPKLWDRIKHFIDEATEKNGGIYTTEDVYNWLISGERQLWCAYEDEKVYGVVISGMNLQSRKKILWIDICTGDRLDEWVDNIKQVEEWAKSQGVERMWLMARAGYEKKLKKYDYKKTHVFLEKEI